MKTSELAMTLGIPTRKLRVILRSFNRFDDKRYTRYLLNKRDIKQVENALAKENAEDAA